MILLHVTDVLPLPAWECDPIYFERGKHIHRACHLLDTTGLDWNTVHTPWRGYIRAWGKFIKDTGAEIIESEYHIESKGRGYQGRLDKIFSIGKQMFLGDIKTGVPTATVGPQTAAYREAYDHKGRIIRCVIQLSGNANYKFTTENTPMQVLFSPQDFRVFISYLTTKQWEMAHGLWSPTPRE